MDVFMNFLPFPKGFQSFLFTTGAPDGGRGVDKLFIDEKWMGKPFTLSLCLICSALSFDLSKWDENRGRECLLGILHYPSIDETP